MHLLKLGLTSGRKQTPFCAITLTNEIATAFGAQYPTVSGQTFSISSAAAALYLAGTSPSAAIPIWSGRRWIQGSALSYSAGTGDVRVGFIGLNGGGSAIVVANVQRDSVGNATLELESPVGTPAGSVNISDAHNGYAIGVDGTTGDFVFWGRVDPADPSQGGVIQTAFSGAFSGVASILVLGTVNAGTAGSTATATIDTFQTSFEDRLPAGDSDICGNRIG